MSEWFLRQRYGSGAARILLSASPFPRGAVLRTPTSRFELSGVVAAISAAALATALILHERDPQLGDASDLRIVLLEEGPAPPAQGHSHREMIRKPAPEVIRSRRPTPIRVARRQRPRPQIDGIAAVASPRADASALARLTRQRPSPRAASHADLRFDLAAPAAPGKTTPAARGAWDGLTRKAIPEPAQLAPEFQLSSLTLPKIRTGRAAALPPVSAAPVEAGSSEAGAASEAEAALRGVPLGALASCRSDRREDLLKQRVIARVAKRRLCANQAGTYQFVETRNLNAFLMWVERSPSRPPGNRCAELELALSCLQVPQGKEM